MRRVRDYDQELSALAERANQLKAKKIQRLGELVIATGADRVGMEALAGGLLFVASESKRSGNKEAWRSAGAGFFQNGARKASASPHESRQGADAGTASNAQN
jgi:hypothetical protein